MKVAVRTAVFAASSAAFLYTRGQMSDEESLLRDSLSAFKADHVEKSLRWGRECVFFINYVVNSVGWLGFGRTQAFGSDDLRAGNI